MGKAIFSESDVAPLFEHQSRPGSPRSVILSLTGTEYLLTFCIKIQNCAKKIHSLNKTKVTELKFESLHVTCQFVIHFIL